MNKRQLLIKLVVGLLILDALLLGALWQHRRGTGTAHPPQQAARKPYDRELAKAGVARAYALKRSGRWAEAIPLFEAALREYPDHSDSYHGLAQAQRELGQTAAALVNHDRAIELDPGRWDLYWDRGETYLRIQNYEAAKADFETCLTKNRNFGRGYRSLGQAYRGLGDFSTALTNHDKSSALEPDNPSFYHERGNTHRSMGEQQLGAADFAKERELRKNAK